MSSTSYTSPPVPRQLARTGALSALLVGLYLGGLRLFLANGQDYPDAAVTNLTFAALCLAPGVIATIGWRGGLAPLLAAAAIGCGLIAVLSVAALPFVVPIIVLVAAAARSRWSPPTTLGAAISTGLFAAAWFSLLLRPDERCVQTATSTTCGHLATTTDALLSLGLIAAAVVVAVATTRSVVATSPRPIIASDGHPEDARPPPQ
jgi:hypothetical protein